MRIIWILVVFAGTSADSLECAGDSTMGRCLRPLLDVWEAIRETEAHAQALLFPVPFYSKNAVHKLCASYITSLDQCSTEEKMDKCSSNPLMTFVDGHLSFICSRYGPAFMDNYDCISGALMESKHCWKHIYGVPNPTQHDGKCSGLATFFGCVEDHLDDRCGEIATTLLAASIEKLGCMDGTSERRRILEQTNTTDMLTEQFRRDYFENAQKMELHLSTQKPARSDEDYPKMPEIAFAEDNNSTNPKETVPPAPSSDISEIMTTPASEVDTDLNAASQTTESGLTSLSIVAETDEITELHATTEIPETTEFTVPTTTHPPYCVPHRDHLAINICLKNIMAKLSAISAETPIAAAIHFPLYNVSIDALVGLCDDLRDASKCMEGVDKLCQHPLLTFMEQQFVATCDLLKMRDFDIDYSCIQRKLLDREDCIIYVNGTMDPAEDKCEGHTDFLSCMKSELEQECGEESYNSVVTMLRGYGCNVSDDIVAASTLAFRASTASSVKVISLTRSTTSQTSSSSTLIPESHKSQANAINDEGSGESLESSVETTTEHEESITESTSFSSESPQEPQANFDAALVQASASFAENDIENRSETSADGFLELPDSSEEETMDDIEEDDPVFNYTISSNCTANMRDQARMCTAPLMRTWVALRATWPHLAEVSFPVYKYSRVELLELCDSYANVFLCANIDDIRMCIMDEMVRFAQDHLGYICSPQNIQRFMGHYDCIMEQEALGRGNCRRHIMGEAIPGKDEHKCRGVKSYRACLAPHLKRNCGVGALKEFDESVRQFGCLV
ncbi:hypothetical protein Y032_0051g2092 [Ancylostoma ceylanicum]|nr:hypothetical protein Y032_0051g2092 [Ancylostoma ceylanicum]